MGFIFFREGKGHRTGLSKKKGLEGKYTDLTNLSAYPKCEHFEKVAREYFSKKKKNTLHTLTNKHAGKKF